MLVASFLRIFFQLLYHQFAWTYDWVAATVSLGRWNDWVNATLPYLNGDSVLEIGHGPGHLLSALHATGLEPVGLDSSRQMGFLAFSGLLHAGFVPKLVSGYAQHLPFPNGTFHRVVATFPSDYIFAQLTLSEVNRVLIPGGRLVVLPVAWITGSAWYDRAAAWLFRFTGQAPDWDESYLYPFRRAGFEVRIEFLELKSSKALFILADKP